MVVVDDECTVRFTIESDEAQEVRLYLGASQGAATPIFVVAHQAQLEAGIQEYELVIPHLPLPTGSYYWWFGAVRRRRSTS